MRGLPSIRFFLLALLVSVAGCQSVTDRPACTPGRPTLTVVTLNLYHDRGDWPRRRALILEGLRESEPDLVALQEVLQAPGLRNQAQDLAEALGLEYVFASLDDVRLPRRYGNAILSRHPILRHDQVALRPRHDFRSAVRARIDLDGRTLDFIATHLHAGEAGGAIRAQQVRHLLEFVGDSDARPAGIIVAGDFNATAPSPELQPMQQRFEDAYASLHGDADSEPAAHASLNPAYFDRPARIDHVYVQRERFDTCMARRILDAPDASGRWPSDHFGIAVRLSLKDAVGPASHGDYHPADVRRPARETGRDPRH